MIKFFVCSLAANLAAKLQEFASTVTVEAEYGDTTVMGTVETLAHHGKNAGNPCPCSYENLFAGNGVEAVGLSHLDLDSLGGCAAVLGTKPDASAFWTLAEFVDLRGPHKLAVSGATPEDTTRLYAWWAWSKDNRFNVPRDGSIADATNYVATAIDALTRIVAGDMEMLAAGERFLKEEWQLNVDSFVEESGGVILRIARGREFVNALYSALDGQVAKAVIAFRTDGAGCTVSFADPILGVSAVELVRKIWGEQAGGHAGIAGNPRGARATMADIIRLRDLVVEAIAEK